MEFSCEQFQAIIESLRGQRIDGHDQRKTARVGLTAHASIVRSDRKVRAIMLRDLSPGGVGLVSHEEFANGEKFILRLPRRGQSPQFVLCTVRHCHSIDAQLFSVGAKFDCMAELKDQPPQREVEPARSVPSNQSSSILPSA